MSDAGRQLVASGATPAEVIRRAEELESADWVAAVELLESANRAVRSDEVEIALAALRHRAFGPLAAAPPDRAPAAPGSSPPVGESELAECSLTDLTAAVLRAALLDHGCLLVRGALDAERARALAEHIDLGFAAQEPTADMGPAWWFPLELDAPDAATLGRKWVRGGGGALLADSPRLMAEVLDLYTDLGLRSIVSAYLGSRPVISANKCTLRRVSIARNGDWHQDGSFLGTGIRALNLWLTLTPCGVDAPGLDVVPKRFDEIVETGTGAANFGWAVGPEVVERVSADVGVVRPSFDAGDMLLFDDLFLHRTAVEPEMTLARHAIEMWSFAADAYPSGQVPLVW